MAEFDRGEDSGWMVRGAKQASLLDLMMPAKGPREEIQGGCEPVAGERETSEFEGGQ